MNATAERLRPFGTSIFAEMSKLAIEHSAVNLSQGFPDFEGPSQLVEAADRALRSGRNQYAPSSGIRSLVDRIVTHRKHFYDLQYAPGENVTVTCGATEGIMSSMLGILNPGDEVVIFEPFYDSYPVACALAGATPKYCTLRAPNFDIDLDELESCFSSKTKLVIVNTPHNPTGKVFSVQELDAIARLCIKHDAYVLADEVYEHLTFDGSTHVPMATRPGMYERTISLSSAGKTFSMTGWKIGWATGAAPLVAAAQAAHQFVTFSVATPMQHAVAEGLRMCVEEDYVDKFQAEYSQRRERLLEILHNAHFRPVKPQGSYFILADFSQRSKKDDRAYAHELVRDKKVAAIPPSVFYAKDPDAGKSLLRFAFCKELDTLEQARIKLHD